MLRSQRQPINAGIPGRKTPELPVRPSTGLIAWTHRRDPAARQQSRGHVLDHLPDVGSTVAALLPDTLPGVGTSPFHRYPPLTTNN
jgi:hypothetical protein